MVLLSFSSLTYAVERGEYRHYMGFAISGGSFSDNLQEIEVASDNTDGSSNTDGPGISVVDSEFKERGNFFVWDAFDLDNQAAFSLMLLSVWEDESETFSNGVTYDEIRRFSGPLLLGKYFTRSGLYIGGGGAFLAMSGEGTLSNGNIDENIDITSDSFFAPTLVLGYRGLVGRFESSHVYIGADYVRTMPADVDYETSRPGRTVSDTLEDVAISMLAVSFGWAW